jgi:hypothetical protein
MDDEKNNKSLDYSPDIEYQEDYSSQFKGRLNLSDSQQGLTEDELLNSIIDNDYMQNIQDNINELVQLIPNLSDNIQTVVNQVFKPIYNYWYSYLKEKDYPIRIPDPDKPIIYPIGGDNPGIIGTVPRVPIHIGDDEEKKDPPDPIEWKPQDPEDPEIWTPEEEDPIIGSPPPETTKPEIIGDDLGLFDPATPFNVEYEEIDPIKIIELEYNKNMAELYLHYTNKLKVALGNYYISLYHATTTSSKWQRDNGILEGIDPVQFMLEELSFSQSQVDKDLKHLVDAAVRNDKSAYLRLSFCSNNFPLESTLYHMKSIKAAQEFRTRYAKEEASNDGTQVGSLSDRVLIGMRNSYDKKYDNAYINLYKYLNSSVDVLQEALNSAIVAIRAKDILIKKGGVDK